MDYPWNMVTYAGATFEQHHRTVGTGEKGEATEQTNQNILYSKVLGNLQQLFGKVMICGHCRAGAVIEMHLHWVQLHLLQQALLHDQPDRL